jgi:hypothetical protein
VKHQVNPYSVGEAKGAFVLDKSALDRLEALCANFIADADWKFTLSVKSGDQYVAEGSADLAKLPLHHAQERSLLQIEGQSKSANGKYIQGVYYYAPPRLTLIVAGTADDRGALAAITSWVEGSRPWYFWMYWIYRAKVSWIIMIVLGLLIGGLYIDAPKLWTAAGVVLGGVILIGAPYLRDALFDPVVINFGDEEARQARKVSARRWLFGLAVTGLAAALIGQAVQHFLSPGKG